MLKFAANLSLLFTEYDFLDRFQAAADSGFKGVEVQFPYAWDPETLGRKLSQCGLPLVLFNLPAGDWPAGDRGIACDPGRRDEFLAGLNKAVEYARILGTKQLNCLAGIPPQSISLVRAEATFVENIRSAAEVCKTSGITLQMEAINTLDVPGFFFNTTAQARSILQKVGSDNLFLQYDIYHMQIMEGDLARTLQANLESIRHIQLADNPGRHEPGTGEINYPFLFNWLTAIGYTGWIGCEYYPAGRTEDGLGWIKQLRNG